MQSEAFPWLAGLPDEQAYTFLGEVIGAAQAAGTHTTFLKELDTLVAAWAEASSQNDDGAVLRHSRVPRQVG